MFSCLCRSDRRESDGMDHIYIYQVRQQFFLQQAKISTFCLVIWKGNASITKEKYNLYVTAIIKMFITSLQSSKCLG